MGPPLTPEALGDTGLVTQSDPTPVFRRFPWIQLVFCLACLFMAGWTWMRYSYCWDMGADQAAHSFNEEVWGDGSTWAHRMVTIRGRVTNSVRWDDSMQSEVQRLGLTPPVWEVLVELDASEHPYLMGVVCNGGIVWPENSDFVGRIGDYFGGTGRWYVDTTASRFHGASIAGIVVGVMGCFIFWLHLRPWIGRKRLRDG